MKTEKETRTETVSYDSLVHNGTKGNLRYLETPNDWVLTSVRGDNEIRIHLARTKTMLSLDSLLLVDVSKKGVHSESIHLSVAFLLQGAPAGLSETLNTNHATAQEIEDTIEAWMAGYHYKSNYQQALKRDPFSYAAFIGTLNVKAEKKELPEEQAAQWAAAKGKAPKVKELSGFLDLAFDSPKWAWLRGLMVDAGYAKPEVTDAMSELL